MEKILFVSAQPDVPYFIWQIKIYVNNFEKLVQTIFSLFDLFFLFFKQEKHSHMKLEHNLINTKIKLNERI